MILKNGLVLINDELVKKDILIVDGIITLINDCINGDDTLDVNGLWVAPGAVDVHVHLREPGFTHKETIKSGTLSSAKGGITTVMAMPNLNPTPDNLHNLNIEKEIISKDAVVNCYPYGAVSVGQKGLEIADINNLSKEVYAVTDDGVGVNNLSILVEAMKICKEKNIVMASHAEDTVDSKLPQGEYVAVRREIEYAKEIGCKYHFCHLSTKESFEAVKLAREAGYTNITCEVSPHHLFLNEMMIKDGNWKMNPPLRSEENRLATLNALLNGVAQVIASDHAPHSTLEKSKSYDECPNGIIGLETMVPLVYTNLIKTNIAKYSDMLNWLVYNPIKIFNLPERKLEVGYPADLMILDINTYHKYNVDEILSMGKNTPFIDMELTGIAKYTLVKGKIVWQM